ncbi:MAG: cation diffusion facilitator family transporter [Pseudomonadales bacterium]|nr:cation diffusion facilitator family transporter [Pseudomonadales bacterium]
MEKQNEHKWVRLASILSVSVALLLIILKTAAWFMTGSVSLLASLIDSTMDSLVSIINLLAIRYSLQPADEEHRFGHGKAEALAGLAQAAFIAGSAAFLFLHAAERLYEPHEITHSDIGVAVMIVSIVMTLGLVVFQKIVVQRTGSTAIAADSLHYVGDLLVNASIIVALLLGNFLWSGFDAVLGILISCYILYNAWEIGERSTQLLLDRELGPDVWTFVEELIAQHPEVKGHHELRTRESGFIQFFQLHLELDKDMQLEKAHAITEDIELKIKERYPNADVLIHTDPV